MPDMLNAEVNGLQRQIVTSGSTFLRQRQDSRRLQRGQVRSCPVSISTTVLQFPLLLHTGYIYRRGTDQTCQDSAGCKEARRKCQRSAKAAQHKTKVGSLWNTKLLPACSISDQTEIGSKLRPVPPLQYYTNQADILAATPKSRSRQHQRTHSHSHYM